MTTLPLHPALVHLPLGLAFLLPALALGFAWAVWTGRLHPRAWLAIVALHAILFGAGWVAMNTGEREEEAVENVVPQSALELHEEYAEQFLWATGMTLVLAALVLAFRRPAAARALMGATVIATAVVAAAAWRVGHAGGQLVYNYNAAAGYAIGTGGQVADRQEAPSARPETTRAERKRARGDDDDR